MLCYARETRGYNLNSHVQCRPRLSEPGSGRETILIPGLVESPPSARRRNLMTLLFGEEIGEL